MIESIILTVTIVFVPPEQIRHYCPPPAHGCYKSEFNKVYVIQPRDFTDYARLHVLGHEIYHAIGIKHD